MPEINPIDEIHSANDLTIFHSGPSLAEGPLPAFFYFALDGKASLTLDPYNQPISFLKGEKIRCFSFTLPKHGEGFMASEAMHYWKEAFLQDDDFIQNFLNKALENIHFLIHQRMVNPQRIAFGGLSRGGYIATLLMAHFPQAQFLMAFAPLTNLTFLKEFCQQKHLLIQKWALEKTIPHLCNRSICFFIGNHDLRVGTPSCFQFLNQVVEAAFAKGIRSPLIEMHTFPSIGHKGHGTPPYIFAQGAAWLKQKLTNV